MRNHVMISDQISSLWNNSCDQKQGKTFASTSQLSKLMNQISNKRFTQHQLNNFIRHQNTSDFLLGVPAPKTRQRAYQPLISLWRRPFCHNCLVWPLNSTWAQAKVDHSCYNQPIRAAGVLPCSPGWQSHRLASPRLILCFQRRALYYLCEAGVRKWGQVLVATVILLGINNMEMLARHVIGSNSNRDNLNHLRNLVRQQRSYLNPNPQSAGTDIPQAPRPPALSFLEEIKEKNRGQEKRSFRLLRHSTLDYDCESIVSPALKGASQRTRTAAASDLRQQIMKAQSNNPKATLSGNLSIRARIHSEHYLVNDSSKTHNRQPLRINQSAMEGLAKRPETLRASKRSQSYSEAQKKQKLSRRERIKKFSLQRLYMSNRNQSKAVRYKNEKLNILVQEYMNIIKNIPDHIVDERKFENDVKNLIDLFQYQSMRDLRIERQHSQRFRTFMGKLMFFIGYEVAIKYSQEMEEAYQKYELILSNFFQIYFAMRLKSPLLILECYLQIVESRLEQKDYVDCQTYAEKGLLASIFYREKYYEERFIEKLSMCEYYKGNICEATYLHDNNGQLTQESARKVREGYNEQEEVDIVFHHLYEVPRFEVREILRDFEQRMDTYKSMVVFANPRIKMEDSLKSKQDQLKIDIRSMERVKQFKAHAFTMKRELHKHENLFEVRKVRYEGEEDFRLVKRNLVISEENESSQILRAHQSLNRVKQVDLKSLREKTCQEFTEFIRKIHAKILALSSQPSPIGRQ